ncbi:MAG: peptidoglycan bridge formation glycyltransferase FemA/FemB family protein [Patescibacteria group bacterium]|nr:peptidoglycan bridge formation glycyltransferase FemA/FemB family protein [Patescibacteria group bacterium]
MQVVEIKNQQKWNEWVVRESGQFLQSWQWGELQQKLGRRIWRLGVQAGDKILGGTLIIKHDLPFNKSYLYSPRGPILNQKQDLKIKEILINKIKEIAQQEKAIFYKCEPSDQNLIDQNFKKVKSVQPANTLILDLKLSLEELLKNMHPKTRYNIKLAQRKGVKIEEGRDISLFLNLIHQTAKRDEFNPHADEYYRKIFQEFKYNQGSGFKLFIAKFQDRVIATNLIMFFGQTVTYVHGASSNQDRNVMAPYLLQWQVIKQAQEQGFKYYDFWGINPSDVGLGYLKSWQGITRFKTSFSGQEINYPGTFDLVLKPAWYRLYNLIKKIKN